MTTIVVDPVRQMIAADSRGTRTSTQTSSSFGFVVERSTWLSFIDEQTKINIIEDGVVIVGAGDAKTIDRFSSSYPNYVGLPENNDTIILVIKAKQNGLDIIEYNSKEVKRKWRKSKFKWEISTYIRKTNPIFIGSGKMYARGAYDAGCSIEKSIVIASQNDISTNDKVRLYDMKKGEYLDIDMESCDNEQ